MEGADCLRRQGLVHWAEGPTIAETASPAPTARGVYWLRVQSAPSADEIRRRIELFDAAGSPLAIALVPRRGRRITVESLEPTVIQPVDITIRRLFPLTGRVDITDARSGARLGITSRLGVVRHPDGRVLGRFRDARTMRSYLGEGVVTIALGIIFGGSDSDAGTSPTALRWVVDGADRGELGQARWPFAPTREPIPRAERSWIQRLVPERVARVLRRIGEAPCWKLEHDALAPDDARLVLAAAIISVELSRW